VLAADEHPAILEGKFDHDKVVVLSFASETDCHEFADSPDYQEIAFSEIRRNQIASGSSTNDFSTSPRHFL
jgi:uncharacterized protein (DUF1330 family)